MPLKLNLAIPNKAVHAFIGLVVIVALVVGVYAYTFPPSFLGHGGDQIWINTLTGETDLQAAIDGGMFGDITAVLAGAGLLGGGASGNVTLNADTTYLQRRVSSSCVAGSSIRAISSTGTVTCETDDAGGTGDITGVAAGTGLTGGGTSGNVTLNADTTYLQRRVSSSCAVGSSIRAISSTGTVTCETDDAGAGDNLGNHLATQNLSMANRKIINLLTPTNNNDAANKAYVDAQAGGGAYTRKCAWNNRSNVWPGGLLGSCVPSNCAAGYVSMGVDCYVTSFDVSLWLLDGPPMNYASAGVCERVCVG